MRIGYFFKHMEEKVKKKEDEDAIRKIFNME